MANNITYEITCPLDISNKSSNEGLLNNLYEYYGSINNKEPSAEINRILPILSGSSKLSIRVIDWFVTNYSKKKNVVYPLDIKNDYIISYVNVHLSYKALLKGYGKKLFDPFCRNIRIPFYYTCDLCLVTTIAQLHFFKWAMSNKVLDYVEEHFDEINRDMIQTIKNSSENMSSLIGDNDNSDSASSSDKKRHELSENANKTINCLRMKVLLDIN
jgi:hypothetical protein